MSNIVYITPDSNNIAVFSSKDEVITALRKKILESCTLTLLEKETYKTSPEKEELDKTKLSIEFYKGNLLLILGLFGNEQELSFKQYISSWFNGGFYEGTLKFENFTLSSDGLLLHRDGLFIYDDFKIYIGEILEDKDFQDRLKDVIKPKYDYLIRQIKDLTRQITQLNEGSNVLEFPNKNP